jgi:pyruvate dehydrogenase E1 component alpha subunit
MNKEELIEFEKKVADTFNGAQIRAPIHLHGGNEEQLITIFKKIKKCDWVFSSWRSHYHCLLKGVPKETLFNDIKDGQSITLCYPEEKIFTSAIVAGIIPIALGCAFGIKKKNEDQHVFLFVGDMTAETGSMAEAYKYSINKSLPITFVIEDNSKSVCTNTNDVWGIDEPTLKGLPNVIYYNYDLPWPHAGAGVRVQF